MLAQLGPGGVLILDAEGDGADRYRPMLPPGCRIIMVPAKRIARRLYGSSARTNMILCGASRFVLDGRTAPAGDLPTNLSGGLGGFGHPVGGTGERQMVDLLEQLTGRAPNQVKSGKEHGMMISMGGNDKTVTALVVKRTA
ncbi:MAG: 2-oxoacid:acceptor oxidoreductase family protein [Fibrobacterota bacterium]|nr:2-oxoacid:acceptor oxidoreductase family protein [Fibrobacterota bacterium]